MPRSGTASPASKGLHAALAAQQQLPRPATLLPSPPCARHGHTRVLEALVQHGAKAGAENKQGLTAAACALVGGHVAAAKLLQG